MIHPSRRTSLRTSALLWLSPALLFGCAFFGTEHDICLDTPTPEECLGGSGGGDDPTGGSGGSIEAPGGTGGTGDGGTGGTDDGGTGDGGTGGTGAGGTGGTGDGGTGGTGDGGTGGTGDGGTGGTGDGGTGGGTSDELEPFVNEVAARGAKFVEIFNAGTSTIKVGDITIATGIGTPDGSTACGLPADIASDGFVVLVPTGESCTGSAPCVECEFELVRATPSSTVFVLDDSGDEISGLAVKYPDIGATGEPFVGSSWGALPDGTVGSHASRVATAGESNGTAP